MRHHKIRSPSAHRWPAEHLTAFTDGNPLIINTDVVFAPTPVLAQ